MALDRHLEDYYESQWDLFASKGFKYLIEDLKALEEQVDNLRAVTDATELAYRRGQLDILDLILKRKETCEKVYQELINE